MMVIKLRGKEINKILDRDYLDKVVGWVNHGDPITCFDALVKRVWYYYDDNDEIKTFEFNIVICDGFHSFGGTSYLYNFKLGDNDINIGNNIFSYSIESLKERKINEIMKEINNIDSMIERRGLLIKRIEKIKGMY
jgi:hypothetical protein